MSRPLDDFEDDAIETAACDWFARRRSGEITPRDERDLDAWLALDPAHRAALEEVERAWAGLESFRSTPELLARRETARGRYAGVPRAWLRRAAAAMVALAVIGGGVGWQYAGQGAFSGRFSDQEYRTAIGERTNLTLPDGSIVTLNTGTVLRTRAERGKRMVYLDKGQAFFRVAKDRTRPFMVVAAGRTVTAVGTAFDVRVDGGFEVTLVEGKVRVAAPTPPSPAEPGKPPAPPTVQTTELVAGNQFSQPDNSQWVVARANTARETSWVTGRLTFENERLAEVVAEFERYSPRRIVIEDAALGEERVSGTFEAGDVDALLRTLRMAKIARVEEGGDAVHLAPL
ncbi:MAG TPA: FecR domain-containing protein [Caulobacteraceae bacterium]|nr:FecR domain-containing protein [Caulobacteraceae bacterium]